MAWATIGTIAQWNVTDRELIYEAEYHLLENAGVDANGTFSTIMFSVTQLLNALNDRQRRFIRDTGCIVTRATNAVIPGTSRYTLPTDYIKSARLTFQPVGSTIYALFEVDAWELDQGMTDWAYNTAAPTMYHESTTPTLTIELGKVPNGNGTLCLMYHALSTILTGVGDPLSIPDEFAWGIKYGAMADLLGSDGEGCDPKRATYCEQRYDQAVELARLLMHSAEASV